MATLSNPKPATAPAVPAKKSTGESIGRTIAEWSVTFLILLFGTTSLVQAFVVPTSSMESTILIGDHLFVDKLAYSPSGAFSKYLLPYSDPKRGDVIVFKYPLDINQMYVKRVMGLPGDHIKYVNKQLHVNGKALVEPYVQHIDPGTMDYRDNFPNSAGYMVEEPAMKMLRENVVNGEVVVPPGKYFATGDNRDNSSDSRYWGFVPRENIVGKPVLIWWSYDAPTAQLSNPNIGLDHIFDLVTHFFTKTRWSRTGMLVKAVPQ